MKFNEYKSLISSLCKGITERVPEIKKHCFLGGTTPIVCEDTPFGMSFDLDFYTKKQTTNTVQIYKQLKNAFPKIDTGLADSDFGIFRNHITYKNKSFEIDLFQNHEDTQDNQLQPSTLFGMQRIKFDPYLKNKLACIEERNEIKDLFHLYCLRSHGIKTHLKIDNGLSKIDPIILITKSTDAIDSWKGIRKSIIVSDSFPFHESKFIEWCEDIRKRSISKILNSGNKCLEPTDRLKRSCPQKKLPKLSTHGDGINFH